MNIQIDKYFSITKDEQNFFLNYRNEDDGREYTRKGVTKKGVASDVWYYPTIELALRSYVNKSLIKIGKSNDISELINRLDDINETIKSIKWNTK